MEGLSGWNLMPKFIINPVATQSFSKQVHTRSVGAMPFGGSEAADGLRGYWREALWVEGRPTPLKKRHWVPSAFERQLTGA